MHLQSITGKACGGPCPRDTQWRDRAGISPDFPTRGRLSDTDKAHTLARKADAKSLKPMISMRTTPSILGNLDKCSLRRKSLLGRQRRVRCRRQAESPGLHFDHELLA
ncbi:MAG: hypothetical protein ACI8QS_001929 [Planctomycetota bacterium]|jgi:hypothetical protein